MSKNILSSFPLLHKIRPDLRITLILLVYLNLFALFDRLAFTIQASPGIVAWYLPDGLSFALLLVLGARFLPAIAIASLISSLFIFQFSLPPAILFGWALLLSLTYGLAAWILRRIGFHQRLLNTRDLLWLILSTVVASMILATVSTSALVVNGSVPVADRFSAISQWWIGEVTGVFAITPALLIHVMPWVGRFVKGEVRNQSIYIPRPSFQAVAQAIALLVTVYLIFNLNWPGNFQPLFLIAAPLIWIALRSGLSGASLAVAMVSFVVVLYILAIHKFHPIQFGQLQVQMLIVTIASLIIGSIITENKRSETVPSQPTSGEMKQRQKKVVRELIIILVLAIAVWMLEYIFDLYESVTEWEQRVGLKGLEETLVMAMFLGFAFAFFSYRRWREIQIEIRERHKVEAELSVLNRLLEQRVQDRTADLLKANQALQAEIIERELAQEALKQSEKRFRALIENSADAIALLNANGVFVYDSPAAPGMLGYAPDEQIDRNVFELLHPDDLPETLGIFRSIAETPGARASATFRLRHKNGSWLWIEAIATNLLAEPGVMAVVVNYRDITDRKQAEEALRESDERLRNMFENSPISIWEEDFSEVKIYLDSLKEQFAPDPVAFFANHPEVIYKCTNLVKVLDFNRASLELYEAGSKKELLGNLDKIFTPDSYDAFQQELVAVATGVTKLSSDTKVITLNGVKRIVTMNWAVLPGHEKNYSRVLVSLNDITERRKAEEEVATRTDELLTLYGLSRSLASADELEEILTLINRHAVESMHIAFSQIALLEGDQFVARAAYPVRALDHDLRVGVREPISTLPYIRQVLDQDEPVVLHTGNSEVNDEERALLHLDHVQTLCLVSLRIGSPVPNSRNTLGLLILGEVRSEEREPFTPNKIRLAQSIGDQSAVAIRRRLLHEQTEHRVNQLAALRAIDQAITSSFDMHLSVGVLLSQVIEQLGVDAAAIWVAAPDTSTLELKVGRGFRSTAMEQLSPLRLGEGYAGRAALERKLVRVPNLAVQQDNPRLMNALQSERFVSYFGIPLMAKGNVVGVLEVFHRTPLEPDEDWIDFLYALAGQGAIAVDNAMLFESLRKSNTDLFLAYEKTLEGWSAALDLKDKETEGHTQRVTKTTVRLAKKMGFGGQELVNVQRGALLHDIGKMGIPDRILLKPGKLTEVEWEIMRKHPIYAYDLIKPVEYLRPALDIPYCHHEKWDGTGYPRGLKGEAIPLAARIFSVVDVWDALSSDRPYRDAWPQDKVFAYLREQSGSYFDPQVVEAFMSMMNSDNDQELD